MQKANDQTIMVPSERETLGIMDASPTKFPERKMIHPERVDALASFGS